MSSCGTAPEAHGTSRRHAPGKSYGSGLRCSVSCSAPLQHHARPQSGLIFMPLDPAWAPQSGVPRPVCVGRASRSCSHLVPRRHDLVARSLSSLQKRAKAANSDRRCRRCSGPWRCVFADARLQSAPLHTERQGSFDYPSNCHYLWTLISNECYCQYHFQREVHSNMCVRNGSRVADGNATCARPDASFRHLSSFRSVTA